MRWDRRWKARVSLVRPSPFAPNISGVRISAAPKAGSAARAVRTAASPPWTKRRRVTAAGRSEEKRGDLVMLLPILPGLLGLERGRAGERRKSPSRLARHKPIHHLAERFLPPRGTIAEAAREAVRAQPAVRRARRARRPVGRGDRRDRGEGSAPRAAQRKD